MALIGDLVDSRAIKDRHAFQQRFVTSVDALNQRTAALSPYTITLGDEIQAVYHAAETLFNDLCFLISELQPVKFRVSIGIGDLDTGINTQAAIGMDGPAFHLARAGMSELKESGQLLTISTPDARTSALARDAARLWSFHTRHWHPNRWKVLTATLEQQTARTIAERLGISRVAVYRNRAAGGLDIVSDLGDSIAREMDAWLRADA